MAFRSWWVGGLCGLAMLTFACQDRGLGRCSASFSAARYEEAARLCAAAYQGSSDPGAGAMAARALGRLGKADEALAWVERLRGTSAEPGLWSLAGALYQQRGERALAARAFRRDLTLLAATGNHAAASKAHYGLFYLSWEDSLYREALEEARLSFEEAGAAKDREAQARALEGLYTVLYALGDLGGARQALTLAARLLPPERTADRARLLANQGILGLDEGRPEMARHDIEQALALMPPLQPGSGDRRFFRSSHLNLVQAALDRGDLEDAGRHLEAAWQSAEPAGRPETALLYYQARVERARHRLEAAAGALAEALAADPVPDWAWDLEHERGLLAEERGDLATAERAYESAASVIGGMRRSLAFDELKAWLLDRKRQPFESLFLLQARGGRAAEALATVERAKARTFQDAFLQATVREPASARDLWTAAAERADTLRGLFPAMSESPASGPVPVERALAATRGHRVLVYFEARDEVWLLDVDDGRVRPLRLSASAVQIAELVDAALTAPDDPDVAARLGALLLPPALRLSAGSTLHIVVDDTLAHLPFASLRRDGRPLVQDHALVYAPGVSALAAGAGRPAAAGPPVILADPGGDLPAAAAEGREVARHLGTSALLGPAATRKALAASAGASVLHIAGHAGWGPGGPWIELADGRSEPGAVLTARVRPRLVVLASCASAFPAGRGLWGSPATGFLAAGSEAVLASLGSVEDGAAREMVLRFYREGGAADPPGGLARAQRALLAAGRPPSSWAPFVLLGAHLY